MKIQSLHIQNFTVFEDQKFDFCDGINVFIGANATGKTHALKAIYSLLLKQRIPLSSPSGDNLVTFPSGDRLVLPSFFPVVTETFRPADDQPGNLIRHGEELNAKIAIETDSQTVEILINSNRGVSGADGIKKGTFDKEKAFVTPLFFPPREMLSAYEGFAALYEKREVSFDKTYYDICRHLAVPVLREERLPDLISDLTDILGGSVIEKGGRFYIKQPTGKLLEAHLLAEGHRKLAMLVRLITNGEIEKDTVLLWDEPESGLNPVLTTKVAQTIRQLAAAGVQVFVATHDYLLTSELSVLAEYKQKPDVPTRFFAFSRPSDDPATPVSVQSGDLLQDLSDNPILKEFVAHYDREERLFAASQRKQGAAR